MQNTKLNKRFNYTLLAALLIHLLGIFAFGFSWANSVNQSKTIEVTLAQHKATKEVENADFYAQIDQLGSGESQKKERLSDQQLPTESTQRLTSDNPIQAEQIPNTVEHSSVYEKAQQLFEENVSSFDVIVSIHSPLQFNTQQQLTTPQTQAHVSSKPSIAEQINTLKSQINLRRQQIAKAPKKRVISTMSTKSHQDAAYLENWRQRILTVGNIHYPKAANEQKIYGQVRLLIAMQANGEIKSIEILESSGKRILDHSAVKIIRLAAPFQPFSPQMRQTTDVLEIIRTIEFEKTTQIY